MMKFTRLLVLAVTMAVGLGLASTASQAGARSTDSGSLPDIRPLREPLGVPASVLDGWDERTPWRVPAQQTTMIDDFEQDPWPDSLIWIFVGDLNESTAGEYKWAPSTCRSNGGQRSLRAIGGGVDGALLDCHANYPNRVLSSAIMELDLTGYAGAGVLNLLFDFWLNTRTDPENGVVPDGLFVNYVIIDDVGNRDIVTIDGITSRFPERFFDAPRVIDLLNAQEIYEPYRTFDLSGKRVLLEFLFVSSHAQSTFPEGVYIDNVRMEADMTAPTATTPTPRTPTPTQTGEVTITPSVTVTTTSTVTSTVTVTPTVSVTPSETITATVTVTPTLETPTEPPPGPRLFLPRVLTKKLGDQPTEPVPTAAPTDLVPTEEPTAGPTVEPTPGGEPPSVPVELAEVGGSGKSGDALLVQVDDDLSVELLIAPTSMDDDHPAHIHTGTCAALGAVVHPLTNVVEGMSATTLADVALASVADAGHAIAVHESADNMQTIIACGDIPMYVP